LQQTDRKKKKEEARWHTDNGKKGKGGHAERKRKKKKLVPPVLGGEKGKKKEKKRPVLQGEREEFVRGDREYLVLNREKGRPAGVVSYHHTGRGGTQKGEGKPQQRRKKKERESKPRGDKKGVFPSARKKGKKGSKSRLQGPGRKEKEKKNSTPQHRGKERRNEDRGSYSLPQKNFYEGKRWKKKKADQRNKGGEMSKCQVRYKKAAAEGGKSFGICTKSGERMRERGKKRFQESCGEGKKVRDKGGWVQEKKSLNMLC